MISYKELDIVGTASGGFLIRGHYDIAEAILRNSHQGSPLVLYNLGWHICRKGDWKTATHYLDMGRIIKCFGEWPPICHVPVYDGQELAGKVLHFRCEWGLGDQIMFARFVKDFQALGAEVVISCAPELIPVLGQLAACVPRKDTFKVRSDYWVPSLQCPRWFEVTGARYLEPTGVEKWRDVVGYAYEPRIGLRWSGNPKYPMEPLRRFPSRLMVDLQDTNVAKFYSFQRDDNLVELPEGVIDLADKLASWEDTAAALSLMDLVITSDTSVAHLAAAMGVPTWVVIPLGCGWQWAVPGATTSWYDSVRLFRQKEFGSWDAPFAEIREALKTWQAAR